MATPQIPALFLSHAGEQKDFTWSLYRELLHVNHHPFFDQDTRLDSLPKGIPFPPRIREACSGCKLGIVVLSHEYFESLWPMLELQHLLFDNPLAPHNVFPIFYKLKPADLSNPENLKRWRSTWERHEASRLAKMQEVASAGASTSGHDLQLDISKWAKALEMLRRQNGQILPDNKDAHAFIQAIVSNICKRFPPPDSFRMGEPFKGAEQIQQKIHELFQQQQQIRDEEIDDSMKMPICVGVFGVGGSGKTTLCKYMLNFYNKEYPGSCCSLQFPSRAEDESQLLVESMKDILSVRGNLSKETLNIIKSVDQAKPHLEELLRRYRVFLILDNVWDWAFEIAREIVTMRYMPGSRLLVTARNEGLLQNLSSSLRNHVINEAAGRMPTMQIVHVPSISEEEAIEALMAYSCFTSWQYGYNNGQDLRGLARSCFFGEQCHPLLLKVVGSKLRHLCGRIRSAENWTQLISHLQAHGIHGDEEIEGTIVNVLKTSYDAVHSKLQRTFLKLGTCVPKTSKLWLHDFKHLSGLSEWLSIVSDRGCHTKEDIREQLIELEYHGLIQINGGDEDVVIHDLQMMLIENIVREKNGEPRCLFSEGDVATLSVGECGRIRYICQGSGDLRVFSPQRSRWFPFDQRAMRSPNFPGIEVLYLYNGGSLDGSLRLISVKHMQFLRYLLLDGISELKEVGGWHGAPNLVTVRLLSCEKLQKIESMTNGRNLPKLQELDVRCCKKLRVTQLISASYMATSLQRCILAGTRIRKFPNFNSISLRVLDLSRCWSLESMEGSVCGLTALEELFLGHCENLESVPDLKQLVKLRKLDLMGCDALKEVKVGDAALTSLEHLSIDYINGGCHLSILLSCSPSPLPLLISAFTNLRSLHAWGNKWGSGEVDVGSSFNVPVSLETLALCNFDTLYLCNFESTAHDEISTGLRNLQDLTIFGCRSLTTLTGLGALTKLVSLSIWDCESLREVGHWEAPFISNLQDVRIWDCPELNSLSTMRDLTSLTKLSILGCPEVQGEMLR